MFKGNIGSSSRGIWNGSGHAERVSGRAQCQVLLHQSAEARRGRGRRRQSSRTRHSNNVITAPSPGADNPTALWFWRSVATTRDLNSQWDAHRNWEDENFRTNGHVQGGVAGGRVPPVAWWVLQNEPLCFTSNRDPGALWLIRIIEHGFKYSITYS